ncbi:DUF6968 family protein [Microvirga calopogonii]|uniref:DUF6968 family protein n=1 Tax=Microvirga calopogonii TaxID=2078013 RepID=UPI000E0DD792|nr:hypothetical protein [Microvirga calopogonii]
MIIAQRELDYVTQSGTIIPVPVKLYAPAGSGKYWWCRFTIEWPDGVDETTTYGVDQFQAIILTLQMIGSRLYLSDCHKSGRLYFETPGSGYGFPVPKIMRDLLIGDDQRFDGEG